MLQLLRLAALLALVAAPALGEPLPPPVAALPLLRVCLPDFEAAPHLLASADGPGLIERIVREAGLRTGVRIRTVRAPSKRCGLDLQHGDVDATLASWNAATQDRGRFPMQAGKADVERRVVRVAMVWAQRRGAPLKWDGSRFVTDTGQPATVGSLRSNPVVSEPLQQQGYRVESSSISVRQLLSQLRAQRMDAVVDPAEQIARDTSAAALDDIELLPATTVWVDYYLVVNHEVWARSPRQVEAWWDAVAQARDAAVPRTTPPAAAAPHP